MNNPETTLLNSASADSNAARLIRNSEWLVRLAALIPAFGALAAPFYYIDDRSMIPNNPMATGPLTWKLFSAPHFGHFAPLHELLIWAQWHLFGDRPQGFRMVSLLLHAGAALACLSMLRNLTARPLLALGATLVWAAHPIQPESVDWITEQKTLWCGLFSFWALAVYFDRERPWLRRIPPALLLMTIASLGKSHGLFVGPVILLYELCGLSGSRKTNGLLFTIPFLILTGIVAKLALMGNSYTESISHWTLKDTLLNLPSTLLIYLRTAFLPWTASFFQEMDRVVAFDAPAFWGTLLALIGTFVAGCFVVQAESRRLFIFMALAWIAALGPMLNVSQTTFPAYDRFQYVALPFLIAGAALIVEGIAKLFSSHIRTAALDRALPIVWAVVLCVVVVLGFKRGLLFGSELDVMADAKEKAPANACAWGQYANTLYPEWEVAYKAGRVDELQPRAQNIRSAVLQAMACSNFADFYVTPVPLLVMAGNVLHDSGLDDDAVPLLEAAIDEPRWERFKDDRQRAKRTLALIALDLAQSSILQAESGGTPPGVAQDLARTALHDVEHSRELAGGSDTGSWWDYVAHSILARCLRKKNNDTQADEELNAAETALKQIESRSSLYPKAQKALKDLRNDK